MAHTLSLDLTKQAGISMLNALKESEKQHNIINQGLFGIPFRPLAGLTVPALACEISLPKKNSWKLIVDPLVLAIQAAIATVTGQKASIL